MKNMFAYMLMGVLLVPQVSQAIPLSEYVNQMDTEESKTTEQKVEDAWAQFVDTDTADSTEEGTSAQDPWAQNPETSEEKPGEAVHDPWAQDAGSTDHSDVVDGWESHIVADSEEAKRDALCKDPNIDPWVYMTMCL